MLTRLFWLHVLVLPLLITMQSVGFFDAADRVRQTIATMIPIVMLLLWDGTPVMNFWAGWAYTAATITDALNAVSAALTTENLTAYLARVQVDKQDTATVAKAFLTDLGLV